jgi:hypothetical protein
LEFGFVVPTLTVDQELVHETYSISHAILQTTFTPPDPHITAVLETKLL